MNFSPRKDDHGGALVRNLAVIVVLVLAYMAIRDTELGDLIGDQATVAGERISEFFTDLISEVDKGGDGGGEPLPETLP